MPYDLDNRLFDILKITLKEVSKANSNFIPVKSKQAKKNKTLQEYEANSSAKFSL